MCPQGLMFPHDIYSDYTDVSTENPRGIIGYVNSSGD